MAEELGHIDYDSTDTRVTDMSCLKSGFVSPQSGSRDAVRDPVAISIIVHSPIRQSGGRLGC